jgi:hypothetical protein
MDGFAVKNVILCYECPEQQRALCEEMIGSTTVHWVIFVSGACLAD